MTGLSGATKYRARVRAKNDAGPGQWSRDSGAATTGAGAPAPPAVPTVTAANASLVVVWVAPPNNGAEITDYDLQVCKVSGGSCGSWTDLSSSVGNVLTYTISSFTNGTEDEVQVRATNSVDTGDGSPSGTGTPVASIAPDVPEAPEVVSGNASLVVTWKAPGTNGTAITGYDVQFCAVYGGSCGAWSDWSFTGTGLRTTITRLTNGSEYQVQVSANSGTASSG